MEHETTRSKITDLLWDLESSGNIKGDDQELIDLLRKTIDNFYKITIRFD